MHNMVPVDLWSDKRSSMRLRRDKQLWNNYGTTMEQLFNHHGTRQRRMELFLTALRACITFFLYFCSSITDKRT